MREGEREREREREGDESNMAAELFGQKIFRLWTFLPPSIWQSYIWRFVAGQSLT